MGLNKGQEIERAIRALAGCGNTKFFEGDGLQAVRE